MSTEVRESLLKGSVWKTQSDEKRSRALTKAKEERGNAFTRLAIVIDDTSEDISERHPKTVDGLNAETAYLTAVGDWLETNRPRLVTHFANGYAEGAPLELGVTQVPVDQTALQSQIRELESAQDELSREALNSSNLKAENQVLTSTISTLQAEITRLQEERDQLRRDADQPSPLTLQVSGLLRQLSEANAATQEAETELHAAQGRIAELENDLIEAKGLKDEAIESAHRWHDIARAHGYVDSSEPDHPEPEITDPPDESSGDATATQPVVEPDVVPGLQNQPTRRTFRPTRRSRRGGDTTTDN